MADRKDEDKSWTSNLVLKADKSSMPRKSNEPSGQPESLWGKINPRDMGARVEHERPPEELLGAKAKVSTETSAPKTSGTKKSSTYSSVLESASEFAGLAYQPKGAETKAAYELILHFIATKMGDMARDVLRSAADEVIVNLKDVSLKDFDRKKEIDQILGIVLNSGDFEKLVNMGKRITDFKSRDQNNVGDLMGEEEDVAVVFEDDDEEQRANFEVQDSASEEEDEENEGDYIFSGADADDDVVRSAGGSKKFTGGVNPRDVDKYWLQRTVSKYFTDAHESQNISEQVLRILEVSGSLRECENSLVQLLYFEKFDLIKLLTQNQSIIFWCTKLARAAEDEIDDVKRAMVEAGHADILTKLSVTSSADLQEQDNQDDLTKKETLDSGISAIRVPQRVIDLTAISFSEGAHLMSNKTCTLPEGSYKTNYEGYEEIVIPAPKPKPLSEREHLISIGQLPEWAQKSFKGAKSLNRVQSRVYPVAFESDENMLLCAPTGAGKTNVAMLTILRELSKHIDHRTGQIDTSSFKIVYIAPMKALVQEMVGNFSSRLTKAYGIKVAELTGDRQLTKQQIADTQIIVTTPEKWDIITRKASDRSYTQLVRLIIIDEIHLLHDERGPVLEAIVARTIRNIEQSQNMVRLVGLSATLPNYVDVAYFLRVDKNIGLFHFDSSYRPCPLQQLYVGITEKKILKRYQKMNEVTYEKCLENAGKNQVIIFVHSRKETVKTAKFLRDISIEKQTISAFIRQESASREILQNEAENTKNGDLQDLLPYGFAMHNAGMTRADRTLVEDLFADGHIQVLVSTATLAWGVNLPAHTVIIKGTQVYSPEKGRWVELSPQDVLQMLGRAGRPQFDTFGEGIIVTSHSELQFYLSLLNTQLPIESQFISKLPDMLNAEIVLGTVRNRDDAAEWLGYTYLYVRMLKSPNLYGISAEEKAADPYLEQKRLDLIHSAAILLEKSTLIKYDRRSGRFQTTELGRISSHYYVSHTSMAAYNQHMKPAMDYSELFKVFSLSEEFKYITVRDEEKPELEKLLERVPIPVKEGVEENSSKINVLLQTYISQLHLEGFALVSDMVYVTQSAGRLLRAMFEISLRKGWAGLTMKILDLCIMAERRMWSCMTPLRQFRGVNLELLKKIEKKGYPWHKLLELNAQELGELTNNPKAGKILHSLMKYFPRLDLNVRVQPVTRSVLKIDATITPNFEYDAGSTDLEKSGHHNPEGEVFWIFVMDCDCERLLFSEQVIVKPKYSKDEHHISFTVPLFEPLQPNYMISLVSDRWLKSETRLPVSFRHLILPARFPPHTELLDLQPLSVNSLKIPDFVELYIKRGWKYFNPIQTQCFQALFTSDESIFIGAPSGSGKTVCAELAILRSWMTIKGSGQKMVYVTPFDDLCEERYLCWTNLFSNVEIQVVKLVQDNSTNLKLLAENDLIIATPSQWDMISRRWKQRKDVQNTALIIFDEAHHVGSRDGHIYEVIISRARYVASQLEKTTRLVVLSTSLGNARDFGEWIGCASGPDNSHGGVFNFHPNVRPIPLEIHMQGFTVPHFASLMLSMVKPVYNAINQYCCDETTGSKQSIIFVCSRKQCLSSANEIVTLANMDTNQRKFLHLPKVNLDGMEVDTITSTVEKGMEPYVKMIHEKELKTLLLYGIGYIHEGLSKLEKTIVARLYQRGIIQVLFCSREAAYGLYDPESGEPLSAHLAVIMGTQYYDGKNHRYVDYSLSEMLHMCGKASRGDLQRGTASYSEDGEFDAGISRALLLCPQQKKDFYKKFLYEGLPVESDLDHHLHDHFNLEIVTKTIENKQEAVDYLTWSFLYRRMAQNPNYYSLTGVTHRHMSDHLSELVESTITDLVTSKCINLEEDEMTITPLNLGLISAYYYINYVTIEIFSMSLAAGTKLRGLLEILSSAAEFADIPIRHHEDAQLMKINESCPLKISAARLTDPHVKTNLLLQAHFSRLELPTDLTFDLRHKVLNHILSLVYAAVDVISSSGWLSPALACMELCQMIVQGMWGDRESPLRQLPYFTEARISKAKSLGVETIFDLMEIEDESIRDAVLKGLSTDQIAEVAKVANKYPNVEVSFALSSSEGNKENEEDKTITVNVEDGVYVTVALQREDEEEEVEAGQRVSTPFYPVAKDEGWWLVVAEPETKQLLSIKRLTLQQTYKCRLDFTAPDEPGVYKYKLYFMCDSWIGCDQEYDFRVTVEEGMQE